MRVAYRFHLILLFISTSLSSCLALDYRYFVAGGVCAAYSHGITTPIDVIKTKMQADPKVSGVCQSIMEAERIDTVVISVILTLFGFTGIQ